MPGRVVGSRVALVPLLALALSAACSAVPAATSPAASPQQSPSSGLTPTSTAASPTAGTSPTATASQPTQTSTPSPTVSPSVAPTVAPTPTATVAGQVEPVPLGRIDGGLSLVVDPDGFVHAAFVRNGRLQYLTNTSGAWTRQAVTTPEGRDDQPSIALDSDGSLWIAFTRWEPCPVEGDCFAQPEGILYVTNSSGAWLAAEQLGPKWSARPSLAVRQGKVYLAYLANQACGFEPCGPSALHYKTNSSGSWVDDEIGDTLEWGPELALGSDGSVYLAYIDVGKWPTEWDVNMSSHVTGIAVARGDGATGSLSSETIYEETGGSIFSSVLMALDGSDRPHVVAEMVDVDDSSTVHYFATRDGVWAEEPTAPPAMPSALAADGDGSLHVLLAMPDCCLQYMTNQSGAFEGGWSLADGPGVIDVDQRGRAHILFVTTGDNGDSLWYTVGPTV